MICVDMSKFNGNRRERVTKMRVRGEKSREERKEEEEEEEEGNTGLTKRRVTGRGGRREERVSRRRLNNEPAGVLSPQ